MHAQQEPEAVASVVGGRGPATKLLFDCCDGKLTDEDLNDQGNSFAGKYYRDTGRYLDDDAENFGDRMYRAPEIEHDFMRFSAMLESRLADEVLEKQRKQ